MLDEIPMIRETDIVYIAGPMSEMPMFNYPAFYGAACGEFAIKNHRYEQNKK